MGKSKPIKVFGKKYPSINDAADALKKDRKLVHMRLFLGWSIEDALTKPNQRCNSVKAFGEEFKNLSIAAKEYSLDPEIVRRKYKRLVKKGYLTEEALEIKPSIIATGCPFCNTMVTDGVKSKEKEAEVQVLDIAEMIVNAEDIT